MERNEKIIKEFSLSGHDKAEFENFALKCIGTGRLGLALHKEYLKQLSYVQKTLGFDYIRGHGLFAKDLGIYNEFVDDNGNNQVEYNFYYLDRVMDEFKDLKIKPFLELGFMPDQLASGDETVFFWEGNITPPKDKKRWVDLVKATLIHLLDRYGEDVLTWPVEVWNEPNAVQFWKDADMKAYFQLFKDTFNAVKEINPKFRVGGPAISGINDVEWFEEFTKYCEDEEIDIDFFTRHMYTVDPVKVEGHYRYPTLRDPESPLGELDTSRKIIDRSKFAGRPMYITEFNTSYSPDAPLHDSVRNAAYTANLLAEMGRSSQMYSYWTFGDVFEENGIPHSQFHGGFGLLAAHSIPKPTYWTFEFFKHLTGTPLLKTDNLVVTKDDQGTVHGIAWNYTLSMTDQDTLQLVLTGVKKENATIVTKTIDTNHGNPLKVWHDLGETTSPKEKEIELLRMSAYPFIKTDFAKELDTLQIKVEPDSLVYFEVKDTDPHPDRGYDYGKIV